MRIETQIPLVEEILGDWKNRIQGDYVGYRNHVYRTVNFCFAQEKSDFSDEERKKIVIAGCFHDLGIWSGATFDYLSPSIALATDYLRQNNLEQWITEVVLMIDQHHKLGGYVDARNPLTEVFRRGDLVDFSLGFVKCGVPRSLVKAVKKQFPNAGFHKCLLRVSSRWIFKHPLNPIPVLKW